MEERIYESLPAHDEECERSVICALLSSIQDVADCLPLLTEKCFYNQSYLKIYSAIKDVYSEGNIPDIVSVGAALKKHKSGIVPMELTRLVVESRSIPDAYQKSLYLQELGYRRELRNIGMLLMGRSGQLSYPLEQVHNEAKGMIDHLFDGLAKNITTMAEVYRELQQTMILNRDREPGTISGTPTGFPQIDSKGGLTGGDLIVIGADTSQGKTSLATAITVSALNHGHAVAFYSMEMTPTQLTARIASMESGINSRKIQNDILELVDIYRVDSAMDSLNTNLLFFDGRSTASLDSIVTSIRQLWMKHGIKGAVVDYLQLISTQDKKLSREQQVANTARVLKNLAKELNIWIIALSQLSRGDKANPVPSMATLRDSGQIEEAADIVILIYRPMDGRSFPAPYTSVPPEGRALIKITKGRNIGVGDFICGFDPERTLFYPLSPMENVILNPHPENKVTANEESLEEMPF